MPTSHVQTPAELKSTLAVELVDALYPQWFVNGHDIPAAFATVAEHMDPVVADTAASTPQTPVVLAALEAVFWQRARIERQAQTVAR